MFPWAIRSILEALQVAAGIAERQREQVTFAEDGFDLTRSEVLPVVEPKMYKTLRNLDELDFIVSHVTAVTGGFGVSKKRVRYWAEILDSSSMRLALLLEEHGLTDEPPTLLAQRIALWERYRKNVPYHQIGAANGDNIHNRALSDRTWHGSLGNFGVGWALDVGANQVLENWHIETGRASLRTLTGRILKVSEAARTKGVRIAPHRAFSPSRRNDTGANVHREIIVPCAQELDALDIDYHISKGKGRPVPSKWDSAALYDNKGRKLNETETSRP